MVEFEEDGTIKDKIYPHDCAVRGKNWQLVILITHDKCTFFANDGI